MAISDGNVTRDLAKGAGELIQSPRVAGAVSGSTIAAWFGDVFNMIAWGNVAACIGALLSLVLIVVQLLKWRLDRRRLLLQIELLEAETAAKASGG